MDPRILQPPPGQNFEVWQKKRVTFISSELSRKGCNFFVSKMLIFSLTLAEIIKDISGGKFALCTHFCKQSEEGRDTLQVFFVMGRDSL